MDTAKLILHGELPVDAYIDEEQFQQEQKELFGNSWVFAGLEDDIKNSGDYFTTKIGLNPILIIRGEDNKLRAFHNLCRHRGTQLLRTKGNTKKVINCPYHNWSYSLEGELKTVPNKGSFDADKISGLRLRKASIETWQGLIFVNPNPNAGSFHEWMGGIQQYIGVWDLNTHEEYRSEAKTYEVNANWKSVIENFIDVYHLGHLHQNTLNMYDHKNMQEYYASHHWSSFDPLKKEYVKEYKMEDFPEPVGAYVHCLFPTLGLSESEDGTISLFIVIPVSAGKTIIKLRHYYDPKGYEEYNNGYWKALKSYSKELLKYSSKPKTHSDDPLESGDFMEEDIYAVEQQHKAMHSPYFDVAAMSETETAIINFQKQVLKFYRYNLPEGQK